jgi:hypothetical protein
MSRLDMYINNLCSEIRKFCPQALIEVSKEPYEDEDANIEVIIPNGVLDIDFELKMAEKSVDLQRQEGYNILILTYNGKWGKLHN